MANQERLTALAEMVVINEYARLLDVGPGALRITQVGGVPLCTLKTVHCEVTEGEMPAKVMERVTEVVSLLGERIRFLINPHTPWRRLGDSLGVAARDAFGDLNHLGILVPGAKVYLPAGIGFQSEVYGRTRPLQLEVDGSVSFRAGVWRYTFDGPPPNLREDVAVFDLELQHPDSLRLHKFRIRPTSFRDGEGVL